MLGQGQDRQTPTPTSSSSPNPSNDAPSPFLGASIEDRTNRFLADNHDDEGSSPSTTPAFALRERAASQPPHTSQPNYFSSPSSAHFVPSSVSRASWSRSPLIVPRVPPSMRSLSSSSHGPAASARSLSQAHFRPSVFDSTLEDDEDAEAAFEEHLSRGRTVAGVDPNKSRSQSVSAFGVTASSPLAYGDDTPSASPQTSAVGGNSATFRDLWARAGDEQREEDGNGVTTGGGSGATSRRHSVSVLQPRRDDPSPIGGLLSNRSGLGVGFSGLGSGGLALPSDGGFASRYGGFGTGLGSGGGLMLSDEELLGDLDMSRLNLGADRKINRQVPPSQPSSLPIYTPISHSPQARTPFHVLNRGMPSSFSSIPNSTSSRASDLSERFDHSGDREQYYEHDYLDGERESQMYDRETQLYDRDQQYYEQDYLERTAARARSVSRSRQPPYAPVFGRTLSGSAYHAATTSPERATYADRRSVGIAASLSERVMPTAYAPAPGGGADVSTSYSDASAMFTGFSRPLISPTARPRVSPPMSAAEPHMTSINLNTNVGVGVGATSPTLQHSLDSPHASTPTTVVNPQQPPYYGHERRISMHHAHPHASHPAHAHTPVNAGLSELGKGVPLHSVPASWPLYIVEFKAGRTDLFYFADGMLDGAAGSEATATRASDIHVGDLVIVEADRGKDLGKVVNDSITITEVEIWQQKQRSAGPHFGSSDDPTSPTSATGKKEISPKKIYGRATPQDTQLLAAKQQDEAKALELCKTKVRGKKLPMEVIDAEYQWDRRKLTFYFIAEKRIDFRELVRELFRLYKTRIWMASLQGGVSYDQ